MATKMQPKTEPKEDVVTNPWTEQFAMVPHWLLRAEGLTPGEFKTLVGLILHLGGRRRAPMHFSHNGMAERCHLDPVTVGKAMKKFQERGWLLFSGPQNWRNYRIDLDAIARDLHKPLLPDTEHVDTLPPLHGVPGNGRQWGGSDDGPQPVGEKPTLTVADLDLAALTQEQLDHLDRGDLLVVARMLGLEIPYRTKSSVVITTILEHQQSGS